MIADSRRLPRFLLTAGSLYIAWYFLYHQVLLPSQTLDVALCQHIASVSSAVLRALGFASTVKHTYLYLNGYHMVSVGWQCDGLPLMALFAIFIVAYPGPWRTKLWFVPLGILAIHVLNILRVVALALNQYYSRSTFEFNHHYTFALVVYAFIFWFWTIWVRRYAGRTPSAPSSPAVPTSTPTSVNAA